MDNRELPYTCWSDFSLVSDEKCLEALYFFPTREYGERPYDALVVDEDHAVMWNVDSNYLIGLKNGLSAGGSGKALLEQSQPFWVDSYGNAHLLADDLVSEKQPSEQCLTGDQNCALEKEVGPLDRTELLLENKYEQDLRRRFDERTTIHVIVSSNLTETLNRRPSARLLLVDQYRTFITLKGGTRERAIAYPNLDFTFTSAPTIGTLTPDEENTFYELCRREQARFINREITSNVSREAPPRDIFRHAHEAWRTFVPDNDSLPLRYTDIRHATFYLFEDSTNVVFWRNLTAQMLLLHANRRDNVIRPTDTAVVISVSFNGANAVAGSDFQLASLRRLKRFMAFLCKIYGIIAKLNLRNIPDFYWSVCGDQIDTLFELHNAYTREYVIGARENLIGFNRFLRLDLAAAVVKRHNLVRSHCALYRPAAKADSAYYSCATKDIEKRNKDETVDSVVSGVFYSTLVGPVLLPSPIGHLGDGVSLLVQSGKNPFIFKLRQFEY